MRNLSSVVLSLAAMMLSGLTTYLSFFDVRYTLTAAVASVGSNFQSGFSSTDGGIEATYIAYVRPQLILSNRGTRPVVLTDIALFASSAAETCLAGEGKTADRLQGHDAAPATIVEPNSVREVPLEFQLPKVNAVAADPARLDLKDGTQLWCLRWTIFDHAGRRHEPAIPAFTLTTAYVPEPGETIPGVEASIDFPKGPQKLVARGLS